jgi:hypothetical protein
LGKTTRDPIAKPGALYSLFVAIDRKSAIVAKSERTCVGGAPGDHRKLSEGGGAEAYGDNCRKQACLLKISVHDTLFVPVGLLVIRFFSFFRPGSCSCNLRDWLTAEESH